MERHINSTLEEEVKNHISRVNKFPGEQYSLNSKEGSELEDIFYYLLDIKEKKEQLSSETIGNIYNTLNLLITKKIRGLV